MFECGSADGSVIRELKSRGLEARGCEFNKEILKGCDPDTRKRIARTNVYEALNVIPDNSYDCVYETAAQYIPETYLLEYFQRIRRIVKRDLVIVLHTREEDSVPHTGQLNHWPAKQWEALIASAGFENAFIAKNTAPFTFERSNMSIDPSLYARLHPDLLIHAIEKALAEQRKTRSYLKIQCIQLYFN